MDVGVFNADWSNRSPSIQTLDKLASYISGNIGTMDWPGTFVITETRKTFQSKLNKALNNAYWTLSLPLTYDYILMGWHADKYAINKATPVWQSAEGKYVGVILDDLTTKRSVLYCGVHHPFMKVDEVREANRLTAKFIEEARAKYDFDLECIGGDFNKTPRVLHDWMPDGLRLAIGVHDDLKTTKKGTPDNILYSHNMDMTRINIRKGLLSHHPLDASFEMEE
eukprot:TRINITY_DN15832_c1_g1_i2.p1 TRINITY_DN15832_c1_g1~~TRINITY_DN15832_c1_g1_i2.p1  ORF type:complete len:224 (+),score=35.08 TRINITY_DN15832_c1_g1_i2:151-822(+)